MEYLIIANPVAGKGKAKKLIPLCIEKLNQLKINYDLVETEGPGHAIDLAYQAAREGRKCVVSAGGDGTCNEVVNGLMRARQEGFSETALSVLCIGRGNDFAYGMGIPTHWEIGCQALADGHSRRIDIGLVKSELYPEGRYFCNGVGSGFDTLVGFEAAKITWLHGMSSYLVATIRTIFIFETPNVEVSLDDETITSPMVMISVMNGRRMGGSFMMAPSGDPEDSFLDVCMVGNITRMQTLGAIPLFIKGTQANHPMVKMRRSRKVNIRVLSGSIPAHADGETLCTKGSFLSIELLPSQIDLICPDGAV